MVLCFLQNQFDLLHYCYQHSFEYDFDDVEIVNNDFDEMKMFDQVGIVENVFLGKVDNGFDNMDIVHNDTADELAVNDDSEEAV